VLAPKDNQQRLSLGFKLLALVGGEIVSFPPPFFQMRCSTGAGESASVEVIIRPLLVPEPPLSSRLKARRLFPSFLKSSGRNGSISTPAFFPPYMSFFLRRLPLSGLGQDLISF